MKLSVFFDRAIQTAIENDPRGKDFVLAELQRRKKEYDDLSPKEKKRWDTECLTNPYSDSRILFGQGDEDIRTALIGIDIDVGEILLAETLRQRNRPVDMILSHHPSAGALANLSSVMAMQSDILNLFGVPINIAEGTLEGRMKEIERKVMPANHSRAADAARLLNMPLACLHTPGDNMVATFLQRIFDEKKPYTLEDIVDILMEIPEYQVADKNGNGPRVFIGSAKRRVGRVFVDMTGGTGGAKEIFQSLSSSGINTIVGMHLGEDHRQEAEKNHINVVIAGHISSDTLGMNLLLDAVMKEERIEVIECSGFRRFSRLSVS